MNALWSRIGTCSYQLNQFDAWETMQEKRGLKTARSIEKALEWDQKSSFSGEGNATVVAFRAGTSITDAVSDSNCACHNDMK